MAGVAASSTASPTTASGSAAGDAAQGLPRGPHRLPREVIKANQRSRLLAAAARAMERKGYAALTVEHIIDEAGVSRTTFYENFDNKHDCIRIAHEEVFDRLAGALFRACASRAEWHEKVAAAVGAAVRFSVDSPEEARLLVVDAVGADPVLTARVLSSNEHLVGMLRSGRERHPQAAALPELTERALIGAATSIIGGRLMAGQAEDLPELEPQLVQLILLPYLGAEEAQRAVVAAA